MGYRPASELDRKAVHIEVRGIVDTGATLHLMKDESM
eukprot:COSAG01_NODE_49652_length_370_cov_0.940959_1_plen_36_part_10